MIFACTSVPSVKSVAAPPSSARRQVILFAAHLWSRDHRGEDAGLISARPGSNKRDGTAKKDDCHLPERPLGQERRRPHVFCPSSGHPFCCSSLELNEAAQTSENAKKSNLH